MFVRHLMASTALSTGPSYRPSDVGVYGPQYIQWELDRAAGMLYRTPLTGRPSIAYLGTHGASGRVTVSSIRSGALRNYIYDADNVGLLEPPIASYPSASTFNALPIDTTSTAHVWSNNPALAQPTNAYEFRYFDFVTGQTFQPLTIPRAELPNGLCIGSNGDSVYLLAGAFLGFKQRTSNAWFTTIPASGGRADRASVPRQIFEEQGLSTFVRFRAAPTPEGISFVAWRRPMTSATRVRAMRITPSNSTTFVQFTRRGKSYLPIRLDVTEIEIGPSTGTGTVSGQPVSYHAMVEHPSAYYGFVVIDGTATSFIMTASGTADRTTPVSQYLAEDGAPTGEFIMSEFGYWPYVSPIVVPVGARAYTVTASNLITLPIGSNGAVSTGANAPFNVLDLAGTFVKTGANPPVAGVVYPLLNADVLVSQASIYKTPAWASYDLGGTWQRLQLWGPRGSRDPNFPDINAYPSSSELGSLQRHFYV